MKRLAYSSLKIALAALAFMAITVSCNDDDTGYVDVADRLFMPLYFNDSIYVEENTMHVGWYGLKEATGYRLQLSTDGFETIFLEQVTPEYYVIIPDLPYSTAFNIRLQAVAANESRNSLFNEFESSVSTESGPVINILKAIQELTSSSVTIAWEQATEYNVTGVTLYQGGVETETVTSGLSNHEYTFTGLTPETGYSVTLLSDHELYPYVGSVSFTTYPTGYITVNPGDDLDALVARNPGGTFLLKQGGSYSLNNPDLDKSMYIIGDVGEEKVLFYIEGEYEPVANANVGFLRFRNLDIDGYPEGAADYVTGMFISDGDNAPFTLDLVEFTDCTISNTQWAFIYLKYDGQVINNVVIDNCVMNNLGAEWGQEAPVVGVQGSGNGYHNVSVTNSTLMNCPGGVVKSNISASGDITIENYTFYYTMRGTYPLINYQTFDVAGNITVRNNLFGKNFAQTDDDTGVGATVNGTGLVSTSLITGNYGTSDYRAEENPIPGLSSAGGDSYEVFRDPDNRDLTIIGRTMTRVRAGDQRWYE
ncbi:MAG: DUF5123 domain-containing protein [Alistipes sp.]|nr:DUF5123 domain-containing protein [Alistipes sp.]